MTDFEQSANLKPLPFRGGVGGGDSQPSATPRAESKPIVPTPTPPLKGRGLSHADYAKRINAVPSTGRGKDWGLTAEFLEELHRRANEMRRNPTEPEKFLWRHLSNSQLGGYKFRRQSVIGPYIADFLCPQLALIVEVDGDTHDEAKDRLRDDVLAERGFRVLRVTNADVLHNMPSVLETILHTLRYGLEHSHA